MKFAKVRIAKYPASVWGLFGGVSQHFSGGGELGVGWPSIGVGLIVEPQRADVIVFGSATPREFVSGKKSVAEIQRKRF